MQELEARWLFDNGALSQAIVARIPMGGEQWHLHLIRFGKDKERSVLERQRGGHRVFRSLDAACACAKQIGFRRVEVDMT